jgi:membrane protease YdiL (CAAX protease family)
MVMDEPDAYEIDDLDEVGIGIFEPGSHFERKMDWSKFSKVLQMLLAGWALMFILTFILAIPVVGVVGLWGLLYNPWALLFLTVAELGFVIPIYHYVRKEGITLRSVGIKNFLSGEDILLGIFFGFLMVGANILISFTMEYFAPGIGGDGTGFYPPTELTEQIIWVSLWGVTMLVFVGFSEELAFRGFLQRRMEMYYREKGSKNYKLVALLLSSVIFSAIHLDLIGFGIRFVLGVCLGYLALMRKYSIAGPTIAHAINNTAVVILALLTGIDEMLIIYLALTYVVIGLGILIYMSEPAKSVLRKWK